MHYASSMACFASLKRADGTPRRLCLSHCPFNRVDYCGEGTGHFWSSSKQSCKSIWNKCMDLLVLYLRPNDYLIQYSIMLWACSGAAVTMPPQFSLCVWEVFSYEKGICYSRTPVTRTLKGNEKQFELAGIRVIGVNFSEILIKGKEI